MDTLETLAAFGYHHADVVSEHHEDDKLVVLFTVPHAGKRRAMTAFVTLSVLGWPAVEVEVGFLIGLGATHD